MSNSIKNISIVQFFELPFILNVKNLSPVQKVIIKSIRGEVLDDKNPVICSHPYDTINFANEIELYKHFTGKEEYKQKHYSDVSLALGRRAGKSTALASGLAIYYATQFDYLPYLGTSPHATIPIISPTKAQAGEVYAAIKNFLLRSPYLFSTFLDGEVTRFQDEYSEEDIHGSSKKITGGEIKLNNKVIIKVMAADVSKIRGMAIPFCILDEVCFFGVDGNDTKNTDKGIYEALAPALAQFQQVDGMALILKISSPNGQSGLMFEDFINKNDEDILHFQVPTWHANPTIPVSYLEKQKKKGINYFNREYGAQYTATETSYLDPMLIENSIIKGVEHLEYRPGYRYVAAMDYATKGDYWALAIGHKEYVEDPSDKSKKEKVYIDFITYWKGAPGNELDPSSIIPEICYYMKQYKVSFCVSDQYAFAALRSMFERESCLLKEFKISHQSKLKYMYSLQVAINSAALSMVHIPLAVQQLKDLREKRSNISNKIRIEHAQNSHDDLADAIALVIYQFDKTSPLYVGYHREDDKEEEINTKDGAGRQLLNPTAQDVADYAGNHKFNDNRAEYEEKKKKEEDGEASDGDNFWFYF